MFYYRVFTDNETVLGENWRITIFTYIMTCPSDFGFST